MYARALKQARGCRGMKKDTKATAAGRKKLIQVSQLVRAPIWGKKNSTHDNGHRVQHDAEYVDKEQSGLVSGLQPLTLKKPTAQI